MDVKYFCDGELVYETHTNDLGGLMTAIEKSSSIHFENETYTFDAFFLNHYEQYGIWYEELVVHLEK